MYLYSTEVRWFFRGRLSTDHSLVKWFTKPLRDHAHDSESLWVFEGEDVTQPRIDTYLVLKGAQTVGAKLRGGNETSLEIKAQAASPIDFHIHDSVIGRTDSWVKWSFKHLALNDALTPMQQTGLWTRIAKDRWLRKISADAQKPTFVVADAKAYKNNESLGKLPEYGCNVELTQLYVDNNRENMAHSWYTICLEAFGPDLTRTPEVLGSCASLAFRELGVPPDLELEESKSLNYPEWIRRLTSSTA